ncbi:MAG: ATP-binding cassette domain-containing protein [Candidatus Dormibacteria bacterium]
MTVGATPAIEVAHLQKAFKATTVLRDVSFSVPQGSIFALLGSNGAGKTTTVNILTTLIKADGGVGRIMGHDVARDPALIRRQISLTGQFAAVDALLTGRENLELIAALWHVPQVADTATTLLGEFGLGDAGDRRVMTYSGGMRRRLDIAMSLIGNPAVLFFDEPTTGLDPEARLDMWARIRALAQAGTTVFLTTQLLDEADALADTIAILHQGRIEASGSPAELKRLVPGGEIQLDFASVDARAQALGLLQRSHPAREGDGCSILVETDGKPSTIADVFVALRDEDLELSDFAQHYPTLDDVFLHIAGTNRETHHA